METLPSIANICFGFLDICKGARCNFQGLFKFIFSFSTLCMCLRPGNALNTYIEV